MYIKGGGDFKSPIAPPLEEEQPPCRCRGRSVRIFSDLGLIQGLVDIIILMRHGKALFSMTYISLRSKEGTGSRTSDHKQVILVRLHLPPPP